MDLAATPQIAAASLVKRFQAYSAWRANVASRISAYRRWLQENELADAQTELRIASLLERLGEDKLTIAFVAEFSRGKSELINAIFFADYGRRLLPSSSGRTTMCPTELQWDAGLSPSIQLLPIETRATHATTSEFKRFPDEWHVIPLDVGDKQKRFLLTAVPTHCSFCLPAGPDALVEVVAKTPVRYTFEPIIVSGRFTVLKDDSAGLLYRLSDATQVETAQLAPGAPAGLLPGPVSAPSKTPVK